MTDPIRLLDSGATPEELALLRAADIEEPPADGERRLLASLVATGGVPKASSGSSAPHVTSKLAAKWLAVVGGVSAVGAGALLYAGALRSPKPADHGERASENAQEVRAVASSEAAPASTETTNVVGPAPSAAEPRPSPRPAVAEHAASLTAIGPAIEALDRVRALLGAGDAAGALTALDDYRRVDPRGVLAQEATLLRIEALVRRGDRPAARALAARFLREHPGTPHEQRVRALVGDDG